VWLITNETITYGSPCCAEYCAPRVSAGGGGRGGHVSMLEVCVHLEQRGVREDDELLRREVRDFVVEVRELQASERARLAQCSDGRLERVGVELVRVCLSGAQICSEHVERGVDDGVLRALVRKVEPRVQEREYDLFCSGIQPLARFVGATRGVPSVSWCTAITYTHA
jgi:hypothetical protein